MSLRMRTCSLAEPVAETQRRLDPFLEVAIEMLLCRKLGECDGSNLDDTHKSRSVFSRCMAGMLHLSDRSRHGPCTRMTNRTDGEKVAHGSALLPGSQEQIIQIASKSSTTQAFLSTLTPMSFSSATQSLKKLFVLCLQSILGDVNYPAQISQHLFHPFSTPGCTWVHYAPGLTCLFLGAKLPPDSFHHHLHPRCIK